MGYELKVGFAGARRSPAFGHMGDYEGVRNWALMDPDPGNLARGAEALGVRHTFGEFEALLESGIDIVVVASPLPVHVPQAVAALRRDIHVLSEVTAAISLEQAQQLADAARVSKAKYMMAENYVYAKAQQLVLGLAEAGMFGEIYYCEGEYIHDCRTLYENPDGSLTWRGELQVQRNGCVYGTHSLGPCLTWMKERVKQVCCLGSGVHSWARGRQEDSVIMLCKTERGHLVRIRFDSKSPRPHKMDYYAVQGTKGCYEAPRGFGDEHKIWLAEVHGEERVEWHSLWDFEKEFMPEPWRSLGKEAEQAGHGGGDYFVAHEFVRSILNDTEAPIDAYKALDWTLCDIMSEQSIAQGGAPMRVPDPRTERLWPAECEAGSLLDGRGRVAYSRGHTRGVDGHAEGVICAVGCGRSGFDHRWRLSEEGRRGRGDDAQGDVVPVAAGGLAGEGGGGLHG